MATSHTIFLFFVKHRNGLGIGLVQTFGDYPRGECGTTEVSPAGRTHLLNEVLSISAHVIHTILVHSEVCLESFMLLQ